MRLYVDPKAYPMTALAALDIPQLLSRKLGTFPTFLVGIELMWLQVTMDDSGGVGGCQGGRDLPTDIEHVKERLLATLDARGQAFPLQQLHNQIGGAVLQPSRVDDLNDPRMVNRSSSSCFIQKAGHILAL